MSKRYIEGGYPRGKPNRSAQKGCGGRSLNAMRPYSTWRLETPARVVTLAARIDALQTDAKNCALEDPVVKLSSEELPEMPRRLQQVCELSRYAHGGRQPRVLDPFSGGESMPLEALPLSCHAVALHGL